MEELAVIKELVGRAGTYAALRFAADTADPANGALMQLVQERATAIETTLLFFELEWAALADERADELLVGEGLDFCRHYLRNVRRYPNWLASRNLANEASDESVRALIEAVRGRFEIPRRWYCLKARLLGLDRLADYDRMAPVTADEQTFPFARAREIVLDCYSSFSPELGDLARRVFQERHIDAPLRPGKRGGAFCASAVPSVHPYVMVNYTSRRR